MNASDPKPNGPDRGAASSASSKESSEAPTLVPHTDPNAPTVAQPSSAARNASAATSAAATINLTGQIWGDFEFGELLGKGGMGVVYRGRQVSLDRSVALKVLPRELGEDEQFRERFLREAKAVGRIASEHVVQVYFAGQHDGQHFYAMEYVDGKDLSRRLKNGWRPSHREARDIVLQAAFGLAAAGDLGLVHRDIKPGNLIMTGRGTVKLMDFGLVRLASDQNNLTRTGVVMGTVSYFSPEQGRGERTDPRSDLYSLGVVFFELLTGKLPFTGESATSVIYQHIHEVPRAPRDVDGSIPAAYNAIVMRCLEKRPERRYQSAAELVADLEGLDAGGRSTSPLRLVAAALIGAALIAGAWWLGGRSGEPTHAVVADPVIAVTAPSTLLANPPGDPVAPVEVPEAPAVVVDVASPPRTPDVPPTPVIIDVLPAEPPPAVIVQQPVPPPVAPVVSAPPVSQSPPPVIAATIPAKPPEVPATPPDVPARPSVTTPVTPPPATAVKPPATTPAAPAAKPPAPPVAIVVPAGPPVPATCPPAEQDRFGWNTVLLVGKEQQRLRWCPPGRFRMGSSEDEDDHEDDELEHEVRLTRGVWLADSECTQTLWSTVTDQAPSEFPNPLQPVESVTREDCQRFLDLLNARVPGLRARLPSEAEWEYAARAGTIKPFIASDRLNKAQACIRGSDQPCAVKSFAPNPWGLYDVVGNVREWCADAYDDYPENATVDPLNAGDGKGVTRGGCWDDSPSDCRVARRHETKVRAKSAWNGLRLAFDAPTAAAK